MKVKQRDQKIVNFELGMHHQGLHADAAELDALLSEDEEVGFDEELTLGDEVPEPEPPEEMGDLIASIEESIYGHDAYTAVARQNHLDPLGELALI